MEEAIKNILLKVKTNEQTVSLLSGFSINDVITVALKNNLYSELLYLFTPIQVNGDLIIWYDAFSTDILNILKESYDSVEIAQNVAKIKYNEQQAYLSSLDEEERQWYASSTYEEILNTLLIVPQKEKDNIIQSLFTLNWDVVSRMKIGNSHARQISGWSHPINNVQDVLVYAETPCAPTCIDLFNKNIRTTMNDVDCVVEDANTYQGVAKVWIDYKSLSDENKAVAESLISSGEAEKFMDGKAETISIHVPCSKIDLVGEVSNKLLTLSSRFKIQDLKYGRIGNVAEAYAYFTPLITRYPQIALKYFPNGINTDTILSFSQSLGYSIYYDLEEKIFWETYELYLRHKAYIDSLGSGFPLP